MGNVDFVCWTKLIAVLAPTPRLLSPPSSRINKVIRHWTFGQGFPNLYEDGRALNAYFVADYLHLIKEDDQDEQDDQDLGMKDRSNQ